LLVLVGAALALTLVWHAWRGRWVSVAREWHPVLDVAEVGRTPDWTVQALDSWLTRMAQHEQV